MRRVACAAFSVSLIVMLIAVDVQRAVDQPAFLKDESEDELLDMVPIVESFLESVDPPRAPFSLKELVLALEAVTPGDANDTDNDGLYDAIENIIGTDYNNTDSDFDRLNDTFEVFNNLDPTNPDTNDDGLPDFFELPEGVSSDLDGDGLANQWDFDNDGDGVNDEPDLSPFAKSLIQPRFDIDILTDGKPTYVTFQIVPHNPENLKLFYQTWDWPYDAEGRMKDLDNSKRDVSVVPKLNVTTNVIPDQEILNEHGITAMPGYVHLPLAPVMEYGNIVGFLGRMFYPESAPVNLSLQVELIWKVIGYSDVSVSALSAPGGMYVSLGADGIAIANQTEPMNGGLQILDLGYDMVAFKIPNGPYLTVADSGILVFKGTEIGEKESFLSIRGEAGKTGYVAHNELYVSPRSDGILTANSSEFVGFEVDDFGYYSEPITLVTYEEPFMLSGLAVEECYGSDLGLIYSENRNQTIAANLLLAYDFLRNSTTTLADMPDILASHGISVYNLIASFSNRDEAFVSMSNDMLPTALQGLAPYFPESENVPIIIANEDHSKILELSEALSGTYIMGSSCTFDMVAEEITIAKTMKTNLYNTSNFRYLFIEEIMTEILEWGNDDLSVYNLLALMLNWHAGQTIITQVGDTPRNFAFPEAIIIGTVGNIISWGINGLGYLRDITKTTTEAFKSLKLLPAKGFSRAAVAAGKGTRGWLKSCKAISKIASGASKFVKAIGKSLNVISCLVSIGLSIWMAIEIGMAIGGTLGTELAIAYGVVATVINVIWTLLSAAIGTIPVVGWIFEIFLAIFDFLFDARSTIIEWLTKAIFGSPNQVCNVVPVSDISGNPTINTYDIDNNGLDVGDRIELLCQLVGNLTATGSGADYWVSRSWNVPWISIDAPPGSFSNTSETGAPYIPDTSGYPNRDPLDTQYGAGWRAEFYNSSAWIEPGIGMPNFPVAIRINSYHQIWNIWYHRWLGMFKCTHKDATKTTHSFVYTRLYFDVLPENINDFANWRGITSNDHDGDGLNNTQETNLWATNIWKYDTDSDGLSDKYERDIGTDPTTFDTDEDRLIDYYELVYGTNATNKDSDGDGLDDYMEVAGWVMTFKYNISTDPNQTLFSTRVFSNPVVPDSDGDGVDDCEEYLSNLNPKSQDTDGDGKKDKAGPRFVTESHFEWKTTYHLEREDYCPDFAIDSNGFIYAGTEVGIVKGDNIRYGILKFSPDGTFIEDWGDYASTLAIDESNGWLYYWNEEGVHRTDPSSFDPTLMFEENDFVNSLDVDSSGDIYLAFDSAYNSIVEKRSLTGEVLAGPWGGNGPSPDQFGTIQAIAVDDVNEYVYVADNREEFGQPNRVAKIDMSDGSIMTALPDGFINPQGVVVDSNQQVYVVDNEGRCIRKFDPNGFEDTNFIIRGTDSENFTWDHSRTPGLSMDIDSNLNIIVAAWNGGGAGNFTKFSQTQVNASDVIPNTNPDWDADGLSNIDEDDGWKLNVEFNATYACTFNVTSDPRLNDTDFDGLSDYEEFILGSNPLIPDTDLDGLPDLDESILGTNITCWDTDGEALGDGTEVTFGSDPLKPDSDEEGLSDLLEFQYGSNPRSIDTDEDGLTDFWEYLHGTNLLHADSDGDFSFDGAENVLGTDPTNPDADGDGLRDGDEYLHGTDPLNNDSDDDGAPDGYEVSVMLDPLNNDTDGDGIPDLEELEWGSNPWNSDSDFDGVPDMQDPDTFAEFAGPVILACDWDEYNYTRDFAQGLGNYTEVIVVSLEELMASYTDYQYIVLVGRADPGSETVAGLTYEILEDTGSVLADMMQPDSHEIAIRHCVWNSPQTVVILSSAYSADVYNVLQILRSRNVTILADSFIAEYQIIPVSHALNVEYSFALDGIDMVKATDSVIGVVLMSSELPCIQVTRYNTTNTPHMLTHQNGLEEGDEAMSRFLEVSVTSNGAASIPVHEALIVVYYRFSDIDRNGDGSFDGIIDFNETTLTMYWYDDVTDTWTKLSRDLDWVLDMGVNTTDTEVYGEAYAGYVWARVTHLSLYGIGGKLNAIMIPPPNLLLILVALCGFTGIIIVAVWIRRRKAMPEFEADFSSLME
ncbi:MAG: hypothetical protein ACFFET_07655 [Candidatus Thorarchaeota archaeon]